MARAHIPYFNASTYGDGIEGVANYANVVTNNLFIPLFLLIIYGVSIFVWTKSDYKIGGGIIFISVIGFILGMLAQTFTLFMQMVMFIFFVGIIVGIVIAIVEG